MLDLAQSMVIAAPAVESGCAFRWETRRLGLRMVGSHRVAPVPGGTLSSLGLSAESPVAALLQPVLRIAIGAALRRENEALRALCERQTG